jgi:Ribonuclease G/E
MKRTKEFVRQQIGGQVPDGERDQCGYCGGWYVVQDDEYGVCPADRDRAQSALTSEGYW